MSRGLGKVQRACLTLIERQGDIDDRQLWVQYKGALSTLKLARKVFKTVTPTPAQLVATRRALRGLKAKDLVHGWHRGEDGTVIWQIVTEKRRKERAEWRKSGRRSTLLKLRKLKGRPSLRRELINA